MPCGFTVRERRRRAGAGKSDPIDALAIARVTAREEELVPARCTDDTTEQLRILSDYRRQLVTERIRLVNRIHADLVIVVPGYKDKVPQLARPTQIRAARRLLHGKAGSGSSCCAGVWTGSPRSTRRPPSSKPASSAVSPTPAAP